MGSLKFVCSKDATSDADFRIEYYNPKNWNDYGYFTRYRLFAESSITGGGEILVGTIKISSIGQQQGIDYEVFQKARTFPPIGCGLFRTNCTRDYFRTLYNRVAKYLLSDIDYATLPKI